MIYGHILDWVIALALIGAAIAVIVTTPPYLDEDEAGPLPQTPAVPDEDALFDQAVASLRDGWREPTWPSQRDTP